MKTSFKLFSLLFCLFSAFPMEVSAQYTFDYKWEYTRSFALKMEGLQNTPHYIRIVDENGTTLLTEMTEDQNEFQRMYNLEDLTAGQYRVIIENEQKMVIQPILTNGRFLKIETTKQKEIYKPTLSLKESALVINMLHFEKSPIVVSIKDKSNSVIYTDEFKTYGSLNKQLNIALLPESAYKLEIMTENYIVVKDIDTNNQVLNSTMVF